MSDGELQEYINKNTKASDKYSVKSVIDAVKFASDR
jgi:hypothetical protein